MTRPAFELRADGTDVTGVIADRLVRLEVTDEDGRSADRLTVELDDRDDRIELPETGAALELWLGTSGFALSYMGRYAVDRVSGSGPPRMVTVEATAADMAGPLRAPRTRGWEDVTLADIVATMAGEAGLTAQVGSEIADTHYPYEAQTAESDLHFLNRLARDLDAAAKPAAGRLTVVRRDTGLTAAGDAIEEVAIPASRLERWDWEIDERQDYASVEAEWGDLDAAEVPTVTAGSGDPVRKLRNRYATQEAARRAAEAELAMAGRRRIKLNADLATFDAALFAGGWASVSGVKSELDGRYIIRKVIHRLDTALRTRAELERAAEPIST